MGSPTGNPEQTDTGELAVFSHGCLFTDKSVPEEIVACFATWPMIGTPEIVKVSKQCTISDHALQVQVPSGMRTSVLKARLKSIWESRLALRPSANARGDTIPLRLTLTAHSADVATPIASLVVSLVAKSPLNNRTLYDLVYIPGKGKIMRLSPNCVYARDSWTSFGVMQVTDLHASRRTETFRERLSAASKSKFVNYNNGIRAMIAEANRLHKAGKIDAIMATGDLVDYVYEHDDDRQGSGNFGFFVDLLTGKQPTENGGKGPALRVPMFMSLGNHDYRPNPYELLCDIDIPGWFDQTLENYASHNLTASDAKRVQGNKKLVVDIDRAQSMAAIDKTLPAYTRTISRQRSYIVELGQHRIVMIDSRWDAGTLSSWRAVVNAMGMGTEDERNFADGHPNCVGIQVHDIELLEQALNEAKGAVVVGIHAPPLNTAGNEFSYFFRETLRPHVARELQLDFHRRQASWTGALIDPENNRVKAPKGWSHRKGTHFKEGNNKGIDYGVSRGEITRFFDLCTGVGVARKVNLVLSGHAHFNVEYRMEKAQGKKHRFYTDFYTETPDAFYPTRIGKKNVHVRFVDCVSSTEDVRKVATCGDKANRSENTERWELETPPYSDPLDKSANKKTWWQRHAPVLAQTACVGPVDFSDRESEAPVLSFRGYRLLEFGKSTINSVSYVKLARDAGHPTRRLEDAGNNKPV